MQINYTNGNVGIGIGSPEAKLDVNGDVKIGNNGTVFSEILELSGTTSDDLNYITYISYPSGYDKSNTRILSLEIQNWVNEIWYCLGYYQSGWPCSISCILMTDDIRIEYPTASFSESPYRLRLMKVE